MSYVCVVCLLKMPRWYTSLWNDCDDTLISIIRQKESVKLNLLKQYSTLENLLYISNIVIVYRRSVGVRQPVLELQNIVRNCLLIVCYRGVMKVGVLDLYDSKNWF